MAETTTSLAESGFAFDGGDANTFFGIKASDDPSTVVSTEESTKEVLKQVNADDSDDDFEKEFEDSFKNFGNNDSPASETQSSKDKSKTNPKPEAGETESGNEEEENETPKEGSETGDNVLKEFVSGLKEKGILSDKVEIPDDIEDDDAVAALVDAEADARFEEALQAFTEELKADEETAAFLKFKKNGGSTADFLRVYGKSELPSEDKLSDKAVQQQVVEAYFNRQGNMEAEDIKDMIESWTESGKLDKFAKKYYKEMKDEDEEERVELNKSLENKRKAAIEADNKFKETVTKTISENTALNNIKLSTKDKKELPDYMTKRSSKVGNQVVTQFQADLQAAFSDPQKLAVLAKFVKSGMSIKDFETAKASEAAKEAKKNLRTALEGKQKASTAGKSLADIFN